jgi:putative ABC transport system permease protein
VLRRVLVGVEVALAVALVSGATLLVESFWRLSRVDPGFSPAGVVRTAINLPSTYAERERIRAYYETLLDELGRERGVVAAAAMSGLPPDRRANNSSYLGDASNMADLHGGLPPMQYVQTVTPGFFRALDIPVRAGRLLTDADRDGSAPVALLNETAAAAFFPRGDALGRRIRALSDGAPWLTIVGIVGDMRQAGLHQPPGSEIYLPLAQNAFGGGGRSVRDMHIVVRTSGDPAAVTTQLRAIARRQEPAAALTAIETMDAVIGRSIAGPRFLALTLGAFAAIALLLSASGVYGVVRHHVAARTREIGVHRALGASHRRVVTLAGRPVAVLLGLGLGVGAGVAFAAARLLEPFLFGVNAGDPRRFVVVGLALAGVGLIAAAGPLLRALRIDPAAALRQE